MMLFQKLIEFDFFGNHTLALHYRFALLLFAYLLNLIQCNFSIIGPNYPCTSFNEICFKQLQVYIEIFKSPPFQIFGSFTRKVYVTKLFLPLWHNGIILTNIEIDFAAMI